MFKIYSVHATDFSQYLWKTREDLKISMFSTEIETEQWHEMCRKSKENNVYKCCLWWLVSTSGADGQMTWNLVHSEFENISHHQ